MSFRALNLLFPVVLALHNAEEYAGFDEFAHLYRGTLLEKVAMRPVVRGALVLVTAGAAVNSTALYLADNGATAVLSRAGTFALLLNAVSHCLISILRRRCAPGTVSSVLVILPYTAVAIAALHTPRGRRAIFLLRYGALGAVGLPVVTGACLLTSYAVWRATRMGRPAASAVGWE